MYLRVKTVLLFLQVDAMRDALSGVAKTAREFERPRDCGGEKAAAAAAGGRGRQKAENNGK